MPPKKIDDEQTNVGMITFSSTAWLDSHWRYVYYMCFHPYLVRAG
jgi:hypothetical protein